MEKIIAIRKESRSDSLALESLPVEEKRHQLVEAAQRPSNRSRILSALGLQPFQPTQNITEAMPEDRPSFHRLGYIGAYVVNVPEDERHDEVIEVISQDYYILDNLRLTLPSTIRTEIRGNRRNPNIQWPEITGIQEAHENGITGQGVRVAVLDTGCDADHVQFRDRMTIDFRYVHPENPDTLRKVRGFDVNGHGTHVCGIIAGESVGIAPDVELMVASVIESERLDTTLERILTALDWVLSTFNDPSHRPMPTIVNMSLGFIEEDKPTVRRAATIKALRSALKTLTEGFDVLLVGAIGNDGAGILRAPGYFSEVLSVGAVDIHMQPASFSGGGTAPDTGAAKPDLVGLGVDVYSALERTPDNRNVYAVKSGTSMATPYVTGIAALYASQDHDLQGEKLRQKLLDTAVRLEEPPQRVGKGLACFTLEGN